MRKTPLSQTGLQKDPFEDDVRTVELEVWPSGGTSGRDGNGSPVVLPLRGLPEGREQARSDRLGE